MKKILTALLTILVAGAASASSSLVCVKSVTDSKTGNKGTLALRILNHVGIDGKAISTSNVQVNYEAPQAGGLKSEDLSFNVATGLDCGATIEKNSTACYADNSDVNAYIQSLQSRVAPHDIKFFMYNWLMPEGSLSKLEKLSNSVGETSQRMGDQIKTYKYFWLNFPANACFKYKD